MNSKRLILSLAVASVLLAAGIAWTEYSHRPKTLVFRVETIECESCAETLRESIDKIPGVSDIAISIEKDEVELTLDGWSKTTRDDVAATIEAAGEFKVRREKSE